MKTKLIFTVLFLGAITLIARENPFEAISSTKTKATYKKDTMESFVNTRAKLPSSARILKKVELSYQNLDGSIDTKTILVDKKIDWHDELILKKVNDADEFIPEPITKTKVVQKEVKEKTELNFKNLLSFIINEKELHLITKDKKLRDFLVANPYKIVLDFKREFSFYTKVYNLKRKFFKSITIGKHDGYYRVAIELDGKYLYDIQKSKDGFLIDLR